MNKIKLSHKNQIELKSYKSTKRQNKKSQTALNKPIIRCSSFNLHKLNGVTQFILILLINYNKQHVHIKIENIIAL